jgi:NADH-quinone oxidoreductase subunit A
MLQYAMPSSSLVPMAIYFAFILCIVCGMVFISFILGERRNHNGENIPYESGMQPTGPAHGRLSISYYLIAMFFLVFDLEAVFIFAWAVSLKQGGWTAYMEMLVFVAILMCGLVYIWRQGALSMGPRAAGWKRTAGPLETTSVPGKKS